MTIDRRRFLTALPALGSLASARPAAQSAGASDPLGVRNDFPAAAEQLYLDSAYIAPTPRPVVEAGRMFAESKGRQPISLGDMLARTDQVRAAFARLVGADTAEIGFLFPTSEGENIVIRMASPRDAAARRAGPSPWRLAVRRRHPGGRHVPDRRQGGGRGAASVNTASQV